LAGVSAFPWCDNCNAVGQENMSLTLNFEATGVTCVYEGLSGTPEMLDAMNSIGKHDRRKRFKFVIHDLSAVTDFVQDEDALVMAAAQIEACFTANRDIKIAIVSENVHGEIVGQLLRGLLKRPLHVFASVALAMVWVRSW